MKKAFCIALALITTLLRAGCSSSTSIPKEAQQQIVNYLTDNSSRPSEFQFEATGTGQILHSEKDRRVEQVVCLKVRFTKENLRHLRSLVVTRIGKQWDIEEGQNLWKQHSCPGTFEMGIHKITP